MNRFKDSLAETQGVTVELVRHFLAHMFDSELLPAGGRGPERYWLRLAVSAFALAIPFGLLLLDPPYLRGAGPFRVHSLELMREVAGLDQLALITLLSAVTGLLALASWESLFPSRRDYLMLAGLPIRPHQIFLARFLAMLLFAAGLLFAINILPAFLTAHQFTVAGERGGSMLSNAAARFMSSCLGCSFVFFGIVALQGVLLNLLPGKWFARVSTWCQAALACLFTLAGLYTFFILGWTLNDIRHVADFQWAPPLWFAAVFRVTTGDVHTFWMAMATRAYTATITAMAMATLAYLISYRRYRQLLVEGAGHAVVSRDKRFALFRILGRTPQQTAILYFLAHTLTRSRTHRFVILGYIGAGTGVLLNSVLLMGGLKKIGSDWAGIANFVTLFWPVGLSMFLVAALHHAFSIPSELSANWIFQINESNGRRDWALAIERFAIWCVLFPMYLLLFPLGVISLGWALAAKMVVLQIIICLAVFDLHFYDWQQLPFACSYIPGKRSLIAVTGSWIAVLGVVVPVLTIVIATVSVLTEIWVWFAVLFLGFGIWLRIRRREGWGEEKLQYEDLSDRIPDLGISGIRLAPSRVGTIQQPRTN